MAPRFDVMTKTASPSPYSPQTASDQLTIGTRSEPPLVVIVGPTASGKTDLAIRLAKKFSGEIICADSRTVYRGMDIGTAKPSLAERDGVPHWGLDLVDPGQPFSAAQFKDYANQKIAEIRARRNLPFLVGGTGLYVDAVVFDFQFAAVADEPLRRHLSQQTVEQLQQHCYDNNIELPDNKYNKRYLIRAIERGGKNNNRRSTPVDNTIVVGITTEFQQLRTKIELRAEHLFSHGVVKEAMTLAERYGWQNEAMTGNIYPLIKQYLDGVVDLATMKRQFASSDRRLAKRQLTWFRRNPYILWGQAKALELYLTKVLDNRV